jgi:hypothetical protein
MKSSKVDTAIILLPEITKGMKSIGSKALLSINETTTVLDYQISYLKKNYNPKQIVLCTGFDHEKIVKSTQKYKNIIYDFNDKYNLENQAGSLIKCIKNIEIHNALVITNGLILFDKIKLLDKSTTYFTKQFSDKKHKFDIGINNKTDAYLFYDLEYKWIELLYLSKKEIDTIRNSYKINQISRLFLFELINELNKQKNNIDYVMMDQKFDAIKVGSIKDIKHAKKLYKKYSHIPC